MKTDKTDIISLSNEQYYHGVAVIMGQAEYVKVLVENASDVPFWRDFLFSAMPGTIFDISPVDYSKGQPLLTKGKTYIYKLSEQGNFGKHFLGCVDADYDYLLSSRTNDGKTLEEGKFLIHTYAYSIENLLCCPQGLTQVCTQACKCTFNYPFEDLMCELAIVVYPLLLWALYLESRDDEHKVFSATDWSKVFVHEKVSVDNIQVIIDGIKSRVTTIISKIENTTNADDKALKEELAKEVLAKGLVPHDSLLYVRGHDLFNYIRDAVLKPVCINNKNSRLAEIDACAQNEQERKNLRKEYLNQVKDVDSYLEANYTYKTGFPDLYNCMVKKVRMSQS